LAVLCRRPRWGSYSAHPDSLAGFKGPLLRERKEREGKGKEKDGKGLRGGKVEGEGSM